MSPVLPTCRKCGAEPRVGARFCDACGSPLGAANSPAEYKQVTILFSDVVHSMDVAAVLDSERLQEVMGDLFNRCGAVVQRYGGTVDKFTGDGMMALFGAPIALEDHAVRACHAALDIQREAERLAAEVKNRDGVVLALRVGLNSGEVVAGHIGSSPSNYTAVGAEVGMAQRMESNARPGGVLLSESTARLVEHVAMMTDSELVYPKGMAVPVRARRLLTMAAKRAQFGRAESTLVGRADEIGEVAAMLVSAIAGRGGVVGVVGPPGIGKSRVGGELAALADRQGVKVFSAFCESHASGIAFHVVAHLLREIFGVGALAPAPARQRIRSVFAGRDQEDLVLLDDLLGISDPASVSPSVTSGARRRRVSDLVNEAVFARREPGVFIIEDAHWIDEVSESMIADFLAAVPETSSLVLMTYRPEYRGALRDTPGMKRLALEPLNNSQAATLAAELLGSHPSVVDLTRQIVGRAAGNPFFVQEIVREVAERGVLDGSRGAYVCPSGVTDVVVPATLQATIAARIDRLTASAKQALNAAAVIGSRFDTGLLSDVHGDDSGEVALTELVDSELIDQVMFTPRQEYAFRHPLIRAVAYESQLRAGRSHLHRRLANTIERRSPDRADEAAGLIAGHYEAAGDLHDAFSWHMRAGAWSTNRDIGAARSSWQRARQIADRLPADVADRTAMRIAPRSLLCASTWRAGGTVEDAGFDELRELCQTADSPVPLVMGMAGLLVELAVHARINEAKALAAEYVELLESIDDQTLTVGLLYAAIFVKYQAGEPTELLRLAQQVIDLADGDPKKGDFLTGSPLAFAITMRAAARCCLGLAGWKADYDDAIEISREVDPTTYVSIVMFKYVLGIAAGALVVDAVAMRDTADALDTAARTSEDFAVANGQIVRGMALVHCDGADRALGFELLAKARAAALQERFSLTELPIIEIQTAAELCRVGDVDAAIQLSRTIVDQLFESGAMLYRGPATTVLVEALLRRGAAPDLEQARCALARLTPATTDPGFVLHKLPFLRLQALIARAHGDEVAYRGFVGRYRQLAADMGFEGHMALAEAMT